jgi:hypothetical protein
VLAATETALENGETWLLFNKSALRNVGVALENDEGALLNRETPLHGRRTALQNH